jgi:type I restriction enzyme R subunit
MTEFKQIIGRGTRINEEYGKTYFTIMDFRNVTDLFADPDFDGEPVRVKEVGEEDPMVFDEEEETTPIIEEGEEIVFPEVPEILEAGEITDAGTLYQKTYVNGVDVTVLHERVQFLDEDGKLITGSLKDYTKRKVKEEFATLDDFLNRWNSADKKQAIIEELEANGILYENFKEEIGKEMDIFDMILHCAYDLPPLTRKERAEQVKKRNYFAKYGEKARAVLETLLEKYADDGIENIESLSVLKVQPFDAFGSPMEHIGLFGGKQNYLNAISELEQELYKAA